MPKQLMTTVVYQSKGNIVLERHPVPGLLHSQDIIIKAALTTIYSNDIHIRHKAVPGAVPDTVLGHESVGTVEKIEIGVKGVRPGDRVAINVGTFCGECYFYKRDYVNNCTDEHGGWALGCRIDGRQSEYIRTPSADSGLTKIPDLVMNETALFTGDLLFTGYWGAIPAEIKPADTTAVLGAGPTGLCTLIYVRLYGPARVIAVGVSDERLELAKARGLTDVTLNPLSWNVEQEILRLTDGRRAGAVLETAGGRDTFQTAWKIARPNAVMCVVAMCREAQALPLPGMYSKNLMFRIGGVDASCCGRITELTRVGHLDTGCLITHRTMLDHIMEAYDVFENKKDHVIKYAIKMEQGKAQRAKFLCK